MRSEVLQGTVLGAIYINDISSVVNSQCLIFADDTKVY